MNIKTIIKNNYVFSIITKILIVIIGFANSVFLARYLGTELKGIIATITNYSNILSIIITFGIHEAYPFFRKSSKDPLFTKKFMSLTLWIYTLYCVLALMVITVSGGSIFVVLVSCLAILQGFSTVVNYIALVENPNARNTAIFIIFLLQLILLLLCFWLINANLIIAFFISAFTFLIESIFFSITNGICFMRIDFAFAKEIISFGFYPMLALLLTTLNYRVDIIMLNRYSSITYSAIGIYSIGVSLAEKVFLVPNAIKEILLSKLTKGKNENEVAKTIRICWPFCIIATIIIALLGKQFIGLFYGENYTDAYMITVVCMLGTSFMVFFKMISTYNIVHGKQKNNVVMLSVSVIINIIGNMIFIPRYGTLGAAVASDIGYFVCAVLFVITFCKFQRVSIKDMILINKYDLTSLRSMISRK